MDRLWWELFKVFLFLSVYGIIDDQLIRLYVLGMYVGVHIGWNWAFARANRLLGEANTRISFKYPFKGLSSCK